MREPNWRSLRGREAPDRAPRGRHDPLTSTTAADPPIGNLWRRPTSALTSTNARTANWMQTTRPPSHAEMPGATRASGSSLDRSGRALVRAATWQTMEGELVKAPRFRDLREATLNRNWRRLRGGWPGSS